MYINLLKKCLQAIYAEVLFLYKFCDRYYFLSGGRYYIKMSLDLILPQTHKPSKLLINLQIAKLLQFSRQGVSFCPVAWTAI